MAGPLELAQYVQQQGEIGRQRGTQSRLAQLAGQAYGAPAEQQRGYVQQAIATDPDAGFAMGQNLQDDRTQRMQGLSQKARMLVAYHEAGNRAGVDGLYPQLAQEAQQLGLGQNIPPQWDESYLPGMQQLASLGGGAGNTVQSRFVGDDGMVYSMMRDGQVVSTGIKADRQMWLRDHPGMAPHLVGKDASITPIGGQAPAGAAPGSAQAPVPQGGGQGFVDDSLALANQMIAAGIPAEQVDAFLQQRLNQTPQGAPQGAPQAPSLAPPLNYTGGGLARPSDAQTAAEVEAAKQAAQLAALPQRQAIETQGAIERTRGTEEAKADVERQKGQNKARLSLDQATARIGRVDSLVESILPRIGATTAGWGGNMLANVPGTAASDLRKDIGTLQAIAGFDELNAMRAASPTGGALGNVTERELAFLQSVVRNIETSQSPEQLRRNLLDFQREVRGSWQRVRDAYEQDYGGQYGPAPSDDPGNRFQSPAPAGGVDDLLSKYGVR